jgi:predicted Ser/Thr protein kinase
MAKKKFGVEYRFPQVPAKVDRSGYKKSRLLQEAGILKKLSAKFRFGEIGLTAQPEEP